MRSIKFRGQREDTKEWIYGSLLDEDKIIGKVIDWNEDYFNAEYWWRVIPETVGQFTGLYDKNGKEIYEGDLIETDAIYECYWDNEDLQFQFKFHDCNDYDVFIKNINKTEYKPMSNGRVIGNIHDND